MRIKLLPKDMHAPQKKYLVYHPADAATLFFSMLVGVCSHIVCIAWGITFIWISFAVLLIIVFGFSCLYIRTVSFDDIAIYCQGPFFKKRILWADICCYGRFVRKSPHYKREFIYLSTKPLQDTRFLLGVDMPKVSDTLFLVAYRPAIAETMREHGLRNI